MYQYCVTFEDCLVFVMAKDAEDAQEQAIELCEQTFGYSTAIRFIDKL